MALWMSLRWGFETGQRDRLCPGGNIDFDHGGELVRRVAEWIGTGALEPAGKVRIICRAPDLAGNLVDDVAWSPRGRDEAVPCDHIEAWKAGFRDGWNVGYLRFTLRRRYRQQADRPCGGGWQGIGPVRENGLGMHAQ